MVSGDDMVQALPQLNKFAEIEVLEYSPIGSYHMSPEYWLRLAREINTLLKNDLTLAGVVITHGTDTIEETAYFLHLVLDDVRPVVLTGAMKTNDEISADGPANLINAVRVAADLESKARGVLLVFNETILSARDALKTDNRRPETFGHSGFGYLGIVDPDGVKYYRQLVHRHTIKSDFLIEEIRKLPQVDMVMDFTGFDESILEFFAKRNPDGLVFQSMAGGRISRGAEEGLKQMVEKIPVVITSKVPMGRIVGNPNSNLQVIYARDLSTNRARILLMLGLTMQYQLSGLRKLFQKY